MNAVLSAVLQWLIGLGLVALGVLGGLVIGNAFAWLVYAVTRQDSQEDFIGDGLLGLMALSLCGLGFYLVSWGAWSLGGLVLGHGKT